ncbi:hypothetical protein GLOIN_2v1769447 [Rhizophagus irregularis DAOM 181602=DAOM 197198]|nr:hypothetical protein GLOIN_2v1769447 [Rhizophagus irregularis DAOM 181602=DAOM 197198]POG76018.1 hypothetical protein GLOIN_2v1769447 [Rhizophagus irregularis DAOM 181602=DAOM 197198]GET63597.1 hypothetical protein GLOIN_2v1769447 [Rhizophagus irregularis DAOM 181602=DAOM 197198]|eukprot:XP_025182884.1 hypothetical protein GLOIN_2v1769447 [Rhizophagus irregularis DAOM 181602=DAOM 197198]
MSFDEMNDPGKRIRRNVYSTKRPFDEISLQQNFPSAKWVSAKLTSAKRTTLRNNHDSNNYEGSLTLKNECFHIRAPVDFFQASSKDLKKQKRKDSSQKNKKESEGEAYDIFLFR